MRASVATFAGLALAASASTANAAITFLGEDLGKGESVPLVRGIDTVNSDAAQTQFLTNLVNPAVETFEAIPAGSTAPLAVSFNGATATLQGNGSVNAVANGQTNGFGRYGISGDPDGDGSDHYWESTDVFSIVFDEAVAAFGFFGIDIGDFNGQVTVTTANGSSTLYNVGNSTNIAGGSVLFWGIIDVANPFTQVTFGNTAAGVDFFGFDDFTIATVEEVIPTPVPSPLPLLALGFAALAYQRRVATRVG